MRLRNLSLLLALLGCGAVVTPLAAKGAPAVAPITAGCAENLAVGDCGRPALQSSTTSGCAFTSEDVLRTVSSRDFAIVTEWAYRPSGSFGTREELARHMNCFNDPVWGWSLGFASYDYPPAFPADAEETVISVADFPNAKWASRKKIACASSGRQVGPYWFTPLREVFSPGVQLHVFRHGNLWISRVCGNFILINAPATTTRVQAEDARTVCGYPVTLRARLTLNNSHDAPLSGRSLTFRVAGTAVGNATTDSGGHASLQYTPPFAQGTHPISVEYGGDSCYSGASGAATLTIEDHAPFTVTNSNDSGPCSLRQVLLEANAHPGVDTIRFSIGSGPQTIYPQSPLPNITDPVIIDGTTQPGFSGNPIITLDGSQAGGATSGLILQAGSSTVRSLAIIRFGGHAVLVAGRGGNLLAGNFIGLGADGLSAQGNGETGILVVNSPNNIIGTANPLDRNVISANDGDGVGLVGAGSTANRVQGNFLGTDRTGTQPAGNVYFGLAIWSGASNNIVSNNVISANGSAGIRILWSDARLNRIEGNFIGTDVTGSRGLGNGYYGVWLYSSVSNTVGGAASGSGNVISGNEAGGILLSHESRANAIMGNLIGTDASGSLDLGNGASGIWLNASENNTIGGTSPDTRNVLSGNSGNGVLLSNGANANAIRGNYIGVDATGAVPLENRYGVWVISCSNNTIGGNAPGAGNVISGNDQFGVLIEGVNVGNQVIGNKVGTDSTGTVAIGNQNGIYIQDTVGHVVSDNLVSGNEFAGIYLHRARTSLVERNKVGTDVTGSAAMGNLGGVMLNEAKDNVFSGNLISGNRREGIWMFGANTTGNRLVSNFIGCDGSGAHSLSNATEGIRILAGVGNTIGGNEVEERNVISGNGRAGIYLYSRAAGNVVAGNYIGTDVGGTQAVPNQWGIYVADASDNRIGGDAAGAGNLISGNSRNGVTLTGTHATGNEIWGNVIGADVTEAVSLPNGLHGIGIAGGASDNAVGGETDASGNVVAHNVGSGVSVLSGSRNAIRRNSIHSNGGLGIDLHSTGVTQNDVSDADSGANHLQNFPVLTCIRTLGSELEVSGELQSIAGQTFRIEFFGSVSLDGSGYGEGERYLGSVVVTTDSMGRAAFVVPVAGDVAVGTWITATATDGRGNTSEFSEGRQVEEAGAISGIRLNHITSTSVRVDWHTDRPSAGVVEFGTTPAFGRQIAGAVGQDHHVTLTGLAPGRLYYLRLCSAGMFSPPMVVITAPARGGLAMGVGAVRDGASIRMTATVVNGSPSAVSGLRLNQAVLRVGSSSTVAADLPLSLGELAAGESIDGHFTFAGTAAPSGARGLLIVRGARSGAGLGVSWYLPLP